MSQTFSHQSIEMGVSRHSETVLRQCFDSNGVESYCLDLGLSLDDHRFVLVLLLLSWSCLETKTVQDTDD